MSSSSARRGWPETCTRWVRSVMTSTPWSTSPLMTRADRLLVAGDGARGEDHAVALATASTSGCSSCGDARQRRARLALAAGAERHHLVGRQMAVDVHAAEILHAVEIAGLARDLRRRAPWRGRPPPPRGPQARAASATARMRATLEAKVVTATRRGALAISSASVLRDVGFRRRAALAHRIGGIADQREAALVAERAQLGLVGRRADAPASDRSSSRRCAARCRAACG